MLGVAGGFMQPQAQVQILDPPARARARPAGGDRRAALPDRLRRRAGAGAGHPLCRDARGRPPAGPEGSAPPRWSASTRPVVAGADPPQRRGDRLSAPPQVGSASRSKPACDELETSTGSAVDLVDAADVGAGDRDGHASATASSDSKRISPTSRRAAWNISVPMNPACARRGRRAARSSRRGRARTPASRSTVR